MTSLEAYKRFLLKVNKNDTNRKINISKGEFVIIFNDQAAIWLKNKIEFNLKSDEMDDIEELLVTDSELKKIGDTTKSSDFEIPSDYFKYSNSYSIAKKDGCTPAILYNYEIKNKNVNFNYIDDNNDPSFDYQETFVRVANNLIRVGRKEDFTIDKCFLDYYKLPLQIDISGYKKVDGTQSVDINPNISDPLVNEIISYCATEFIRTFGQSDEFALSKDRIKTEI